MKRKLIYFIFSLFILISQSLIFAPAFSPKAHALNDLWDCKISYIEPNPLTDSDKKIDKITISTGVSTPGKYNVYIDDKGGDGDIHRIKSPVKSGDHQITIDTPFDKEGRSVDTNDPTFKPNSTLDFWVTPKSMNSDIWPGTQLSEMDKRSFCRVSIDIGEGIGGNVNESECKILASGEGVGKPVHLNVTFKENSEYLNNNFLIIVKSLTSGQEVERYSPYSASDLQNPGVELSKFDGVNHVPTIFDVDGYQVDLHTNAGPPLCSSIFTVTETGINNAKSAFDAGLGFFACSPDDPLNPKEYTCHTAIGDVSTDPEGFIRTVLALILGLAGGILLIVIILNGYKFMVSQGDPEKIKDAREGIVAAIMGIFLIIFSLTLLTIVTSNILDIPGFGS